MTENHPILFYRSEKTMFEQILDFFAKGIDEYQRCVFLTTEFDGDKIFQNLKKLKDHNKVVKLFSYYSMPDPVKSTTEFEEKLSKIKTTVLDDDFKGIVAFNVLGDISRFTPSAITKIGEIEKHLHFLSSNKMKFFCTYKIGEKNDSSEKMSKIALTTHDKAIFENDDGSFSQVILN